jgi:hypothetical protein
LLLAGVVAALLTFRALFPPPSPAEVVGMARALRRQQVIAHYVAPGRTVPRDPVAMTEMVRAVEEIDRDSALAVRIRHGWLSPPLSRRRRWIARIQWRSEQDPATYSVSRIMARDVPSWFWYVALP